LNPLNVRNQDLLRYDEEDPPEGDAEYARRLRALLPDFPAQVLADWILNHGRNAFREHGWLDYRQLRFALRDEPTAFFDTVATSNDSAVGSWSHQFRTDPQFQQYDLGEFMAANGTWPVPPIVLDNTSGLTTPRGEILGRHHLLEGHHRLAFLRGLQTPPALAIQPVHSLWLATIEHQ